MATREQFKLNPLQRRRRTFSDNFKKQKVVEFQSGQSTVLEISRQYGVTCTNVYRWIRKFGIGDKTERLIVENQSDTRELLSLKKQVADLERIIGQKQILLDFKDKMIELAEQEYGVDIKKKYSTQPCSTTGKTGKP
jgi:transposase